MKFKESWNRYTIFTNIGIDSSVKRLVKFAIEGTGCSSTAYPKEPDLVKKFGWDNKERDGVLKCLHNYSDTSGKTVANLFTDYISGVSNTDQDLQEFLIAIGAVVYKYCNSVNPQGIRCLQYVLKTEFKSQDIKEQVIEYIKQQSAKSSNALNI